MNYGLNLSEKEQKLIDSLQVEEFGETIENPYSGKTCDLGPLAVALYDFIKGCEMVGDRGRLGTALGIFMENWPREYYILLD